jgi:transcriptional regulator with XRE-family HTH domain
MPKSLADLGKRIRAAREARGLSQERLAKLCGISRRHIADIEKGSNFGVAHLRILQSVLGDALPLPELSLLPEPEQSDRVEIAQTVEALLESHKTMARQLRLLRSLVKER